MRSRIVFILAVCSMHYLGSMEPAFSQAEQEMLTELADITHEIDSVSLVRAASIFNNIRVQKKSPEKIQEISLLDKALFGLVLRWKVDNEMAVRVAAMLCEAGANPDVEFKIQERMQISVANTQYSTTEHSYNSTAKAEAKGLLKEYLSKPAFRN